MPLPSGISENDKPSWAETEFNVQEMLGNHLMAIVHSKVIVIDPFSDQCAVITGSHNFSVSASEKNDENLVIVRGNKKLAQAYALHINGVYDHYSWRAFLGSGGDPDQIYKPLDGWKPGGSRAQELDFWMEEPIPPQPGNGGSAAPSPKASESYGQTETRQGASENQAAEKDTDRRRQENEERQQEKSRQENKESQQESREENEEGHERQESKSAKKSTKKSKGRKSKSR